MGNLLAYGMLLAWPVVTMVLMLTMPARRAAVWALLGAYLLLPPSVGVDLPVIPALNKSSIPSIATFLAVLLWAPPGTFRWPRNGLVKLLMLCYVISPVLTGLANGDTIRLGTMVQPAIDWYTALSYAADKAIDLLPFIVGISLFRTEENYRELLFAFVFAGLVYSLPVLVEATRTPFLAARLYGVNPGAYFVQQMRGDGFRAMVFLDHGLLVSAFLGLAFLAAIGMWRARLPVWVFPAGLCALWLFIVLLFNKTLGAVLLLALLTPPLLVLRPRRFLSIAMILACVIVTYPMLRAADLIPTERLTQWVEPWSEQRAQSAAFRFRNEDMLLDKANDRPLLGWGGYGRNRVFVVSSSGEAQDVSVTDGTWILAMGIYGWVGYLALFGLLCYPIAHVFRQRKHVVSPLTAALVAMLVFNLLDLLPNSSLRPITWLIAGALSGLVAARRMAPTPQRPMDEEPAHKRPQARALTEPLGQG
ncbi:MAG TPA: hypothetical protein VFF89_08265 [Sphingobium sp.]|nr:hypothetical protein [Sphingobium sp.]